jgi:hypothetical protein
MFFRANTPARTLATGLMLAGLAFAGCVANHAEDRMWLDATVNGNSVLMAVDTGSSRSFLYRTVATDFGLKITDPPADTLVRPGRVLFGETEPCDITFWGATMHVPLGIMDAPAYIKPEADGMIGWPEVRDKIFLFDALNDKLQPLEKLPDDLSGWTKLPVVANANILIMITTQTDGKTGLIYVDTGSPFGVALSADHWKEWRTAHPQSPVTVHAYYTPGAPGTGLVSGEQAWARNYSLGPLHLTEVPVEQSDSILPSLVPGYHLATFGMAALKRLDFILDGPHHLVYLRPKTSPPTPYNHNRLGAIFTPPVAISEFLVAHVIEGSPAYEEGLRDGDLLTSVNGVPVTNWADNPKLGVPNFDWAAGRTVRLWYIRGGAEHYASVRLRDIIGPGSPGYEDTQ